MDYTYKAISYPRSELLILVRHFDEEYKFNFISDNTRNHIRFNIDMLKIVRRLK